MYRSLLLLIFIALTLPNLAKAQALVPEEVKTPGVILHEFMDRRLGMFIHWGPVSLRGTEIGWSRNHQVPQGDYDQLYKEFNPVLFNADDWVKTAKDAGMKYLVITAKHHDGFCLWPSAFTKYNISQTPYKKDIVGDLAKACKKQGIKFCIYYTVLDWYHPDYPLHNDGNKTPSPSANMERFVGYMKNQLNELVSNYHPYMLWFDGNWENPWTQDMAVDMYKFIKKIDPSVIINNRLGKTTQKIYSPQMVGDYLTPEQEVGQVNMNAPWESCITICKQWSWKPNDELKSLEECIRTLSKTAGGNGNLLLNIGPMPDGRIEQRQSTRLLELGRWLQINGKAIYGTMGGPYKPDSLFASTRKGNKIFLHLYDNNGSRLNIPSIPGKKVVKTYFMDGRATRFSENNSLVSLSWEGKMPDAACSIIVMEMNDSIESVPLL